MIVMGETEEPPQAYAVSTDDIRRVLPQLRRGSRSTDLGVDYMPLREISIPSLFAHDPDYGVYGRTFGRAVARLVRRFGYANGSPRQQRCRRKPRMEARHSLRRCHHRGQRRASRFAARRLWGSPVHRARRPDHDQRGSAQQRDADRGHPRAVEGDGAAELSTEVLPVNTAVTGAARKGGSASCGQRKRSARSVKTHCNRRSTCSLRTVLEIPRST